MHTAGLLPVWSGLGVVVLLGRQAGRQTHAAHISRWKASLEIEKRAVWCGGDGGSAAAGAVVWVRVWKISASID
jgi:hypothetical protein